MQSPHHPPPPQSQTGHGAPVPAPTSAPGAPPVPSLPPPPPQPALTPQPEFSVRPTLPDRHVTTDTIEDAYVRFIFYCNPALPLTSETASLREAFRSPPRSGGKSFNTFTVFELVCKFYNKEIRTWTELTTRLGVEPPDPSKDESAQKIAQYGVRLKKWMNSMHVKAFFEYLMNIPNDYWTKIPTDPNPVGQLIRDGVAVEDDMALRALLPHIRPKRGRKRPTDDESTNSPAQRTHLSPSAAVDDHRQSGAGALQVPIDPRANAPWTPSDTVQQMPLTRWPQSAITPTTRNSFWDDALEPRSAVTPSKPRLASQRRGPKNVSSAWRPGVPDGGAKMRGRPPMSRSPGDAPFSPFPSGTPTVGPGEPAAPIFPPIAASNLKTSTNGGELPPVQPHMPTPSSTPQPHSTSYEGPRPARPSISLQVPERPPGSVRLATPPPVVVVNGADNISRPAAMHSQPDQVNGRANFAEVATEAIVPGHQDTSRRPMDIPGFYFERVEDRTNIDDVLGYLTRTTLEADWRDANGKPADPPSMEEAMAVVNTTIENIYKTAASPQAFLINLAAISGGGMLLSSTTRICRLGNEGESAGYRCDWEYGFGNIRGQYTMEQQVPLTMLPTVSRKDGEAAPKTADGEQDKLSTGEWQAKYHHLLEDIQRKDRELLELRTRVMNSLKGETSKE
ncbi:ARS binding protein 2-domain-containing protein [Ilyonectria destructans]|nr:ARS binding protein 2-domain-containing protein [Ilyonectria destructans]